MKNNVVQDKSLAFAIRIVNVYKYLIDEKKEYILSKQILRSGTAIGALVREAQYAESNPDFIHKMSIALKEANETEYWILLLYKTDYIQQNAFESLLIDIKELLKLLISIIKSKKNNTH